MSDARAIAAAADTDADAAAATSADFLPVTIDTAAESASERACFCVRQLERSTNADKRCREGGALAVN